MSAREQLAMPLMDHSAADLDTADRVTYVLRQQFRYDYDGPVRDLRHRLVVIPGTQHGSLRRRLHSVSVSSPDARQTSRQDRFGNLVVDIRLHRVPATVEFSVAAVIERAGRVSDAVLPAAAVRSPRYLAATRLTTADERLQSWAADLRAAAGPDDLEFAQRCCDEVRAAMPYKFGVTTWSTTAAQALALGQGVCQDHAHIMLALCRAAGVPARYVSGHLLGDGGTHAWVEVLIASGGATRAVAFDPCNGCRAAARHLPVATGRDYRDVAPTSGSYSGEGTGRLTTSKQVGVTAAA